MMGVCLSIFNSFFQISVYTLCENPYWTKRKSNLNLFGLQDIYHILNNMYIYIHYIFVINLEKSLLYHVSNYFVSEIFFPSFLDKVDICP